MTKIEAKQKLSRTIVMSEHNGTTYLDGDSVLNLIDTIYNDFDKQLKQAWIDGSNANYEALKSSCKIQRAIKVYDERKNR